MLFRIVIIAFIGFASYQLGIQSNPEDFILGISVKYMYPLIAMLIAIPWIIIEIRAHQIKMKKLTFSAIGLLIGLSMGWMIGNIVMQAFQDIPKEFFISIFSILLGYTGFTLAWLKEEEISLESLGFIGQKDEEVNQVKRKILDTSVIIDGRISDIAETGFIEGVLVVPKFVLNELQLVADSFDPLKRSRGRRGLDILNKLKTSKKAFIKITDEDFPKIKGVDAKLIELAKVYKDAVVITNDYNLNKIAEFEGVAILNINELSSALKLILLPNEEFKVTIVKEGKDMNQGIAYLEDGTMIVVDNGKNYIGQEVKVSVTSILQTPAGRMIFSQIVL